MPEVRLIDANALKKDLSEFNYDMALRIVDIQPTIEAEPVRHGRWKLGAKADNACVIPSDFGFYCTCCGKEAIRDYDDTQVLSDFCPHCGAEMDSEYDQSGGADNAE